MTTLEVTSKVLAGARQVEDLLCLATLIAGEIVEADAGLAEAERHYNLVDGCEACPMNKICLACIINE